jgi:hypothetical protein
MFETSLLLVFVPKKKHCPSSRCALAANVVGKDLDIFAGGAVSLNHILQACTKPFTMCDIKLKYNN